MSACDFGKWFDPKFNGTKIPTLEEAIKYASDHNVRVVLDLKELDTADEETVRANEMKRVLELYDYHSLAIASCRNEEQIKRLSFMINGTTMQHLEEQPTGYKVIILYILINKQTREFWKNQIKIGVHGFSLKFQTTTPDFMRLAHGRLISVFWWTPDTLWDQISALWNGVDGVITSDVKMMMEVTQLYRQGLLHPV